MTFSLPMNLTKGHFANKIVANDFVGGSDGTEEGRSKLG